MKRNLWSSWSEYLNVSESDTEELFSEKQAPQTRSDVMKLPYKDMNLFGYCSDHEDFYLVICKICGMRIKPQSLAVHIELRHPSEYRKKFPLPESVESSPSVTDAIPSCSQENSNRLDVLPKVNAKICSLSKTKDKIDFSDKQHVVRVQPYTKPNYVNAFQGKSYGSLTSYSPSSTMVRTTVTKSVKSEGDEYLKNPCFRKMASPKSSLPACDSQTSMTVFLHHSFLMPNMNLCDMKDQRTNQLQCVNSQILPTNNCLSKATVLTQVFPDKSYGSPCNFPQIRNPCQFSEIGGLSHLSNEITDWKSQPNSNNISLNGMSYDEWNQHPAHFHPLPHGMPPMTESEPVDSHSFNFSNMKRFDGVESQVLIHNAALGT